MEESVVVAVVAAGEHMHGEKRRRRLVDTAIVSVQSGIAAETHTERRRTAVAAHCAGSFGRPGLGRAGREDWQCHMVGYRVIVFVLVPVLVLVHLGHCSPTVGSGDTVVPGKSLSVYFTTMPDEKDKNLQDRSAQAAAAHSAQRPPASHRHYSLSPSSLPRPPF